MQNQKIINLINKSKTFFHAVDKKMAQFILFVRFNKIQGIISIFALAMAFILFLVFAIMQEWLILLNISLFLINCFLFAITAFFITYFLCKKLHKKIPMFKKIENTLSYKALVREIIKEGEIPTEEDWELLERMKKVNEEWQGRYKTIVKVKDQEPKIKM